MFIGLGLTSLTLVCSALAAPNRGPVVRLDNAVGYWSL